MLTSQLADVKVLSNHTLAATVTSVKLMTAMEALRNESVIPAIALTPRKSQRNALPFMMLKKSTRVVRLITKAKADESFSRVRALLLRGWGHMTQK